MDAERSVVTDRLDAELANGVVHENDAIFHRHADVPVSPAPLIRPILIAFLLYKHTVQFVTLNLISLLVTHKTRQVFENCVQKCTLEYVELSHLTEDSFNTLPVLSMIKFMQRRV